MEVFIDTNILFKDPLLKSNYNRQLMKLAKKDRIRIHICTLVLEELKYHTDKNYQSLLERIKNNYNDLNKLFPSGSYDPILPTEELPDFLNYYRGLSQDAAISVISYSPNILSELVRRSIHRIKPFSEKKQEFRDAIIWLTYLNHCRESSLENCVLITENISDFGSPGSRNLHPDLEKEWPDLSLYLSSKSLFETNLELKKISSNVELEEWIESQQIDDEYLTEIVAYDSDIKKIIERSLGFYIQSLSFSVVDPNHRDGFLEYDSLEIESIKLDDIEIFEDEAIISGTIYSSVTVLIQYFDFFADYDFTDHRFSHSQEIPIDIDFSFSYDQSEQPTQFEIHSEFVNRDRK